MLTLLFIICMFAVFGKLLFFGVRAAWGLTKLAVTIIFLPITLIGMVIAGLISFAFPLLLIIGIAALVLRN